MVYARLCLKLICRFEIEKLQTRINQLHERLEATLRQALRELAEMNRAANQSNTADRFEQTAAQIKDATNRLLWMPDKGYYRIHLHLTPLEHWFNEDNIIAIGNAVAHATGRRFRSLPITAEAVRGALS